MRSKALSSTLFWLVGRDGLSSHCLNRNQDHDDVGCPEYSDGYKSCAVGGTLRSLGKDVNVSSLGSCPWDATATRETCTDPPEAAWAPHPSSTCLRPLALLAPYSSSCTPFDGVAFGASSDSSKWGSCVLALRLWAEVGGDHIHVVGVAFQCCRRIAHPALCSAHPLHPSCYTMDLSWVAVSAWIANWIGGL